MNCTWEDLTLGQHCEAVGECRYVVLWSLIDSFQGFVALQDTRMLTFILGFQNIGPAGVTLARLEYVSLP